MRRAGSGLTEQTQWKHGDPAESKWTQRRRKEEMQRMTVQQLKKKISPELRTGKQGKVSNVRSLSSLLCIIYFIFYIGV